MPHDTVLWKSFPLLHKRCSQFGKVTCWRGTFIQAMLQMIPDVLNWVEIVGCGWLLHMRHPNFVQTRCTVVHEAEVWCVFLVLRDDDGVYDASQVRRSSNSSISDDQLGFACTADTCPDCCTPSPKLQSRNHVNLRITLTLMSPPVWTAIISVQGDPRFIGEQHCGPLLHVPGDVVTCPLETITSLLCCQRSYHRKLNKQRCSEDPWAFIGWESMEYI
ncbi:hypothetical protein GJAV_G00117220 [Gymnothorax javanicus]|nr:hypothetical protein GJAV_G00117220 [Gymnothorax javanicus]